MSELVGLIGVGALVAFVFIYFGPICNNINKEGLYKTFYRIGRIKQFAAQRHINLEQEIMDDAKLQDKLQKKTFEQKIEEELARDLGEKETVKKATKKKK